MRQSPPHRFAQVSTELCMKPVLYKVPSKGAAQQQHTEGKVVQFHCCSSDWLHFVTSRISHTRPPPPICSAASFLIFLFVYGTFKFIIELPAKYFELPGMCAHYSIATHMHRIEGGGGGGETRLRSCQDSQGENVCRLPHLDAPMPALWLPKMGQKRNGAEKKLRLEEPVIV